MNTELERSARDMVMTRGTVKTISRLSSVTQIEQAKLRAHTTLAEFAMWQAADIKGVQRDLETANPDASEALAFIANAAIRSIVRVVGTFDI